MCDEFNTHVMFEDAIFNRHSMGKLQHWRAFQTIFGLEGPRNGDLAAITL